MLRVYPPGHSTSTFGHLASFQIEDGFTVCVQSLVWGTCVYKTKVYIIITLKLAYSQFQSVFPIVHAFTPFLSSKLG